MPKLNNIEFATMVLHSMDVSERIGVCAAALGAISDPAQHDALRHAGHQIARHADCLERATRLAAYRDGYCQPEGAQDVPGHLSGAGLEPDRADPSRSFWRRNAKGHVHG